MLSQTWPRRERGVPWPAILCRSTRAEVIDVSLDGEARALQDLWEEGAEVAIGEEDRRQAARS